jgi:hypothetical protein
LSTEFVNAPVTQSWRDIPQPVKPRAMSRGGRRRLLTAGLRTAGGVAIVLALVWAGWTLTNALRQDARAMPAAAKAVPVKAPELKTNGVLNAAWLARRLALPRQVSLMELDLEQLRARLLADGQVQTATLTRHFPDRLLVSVTERLPIARLMAEWKGSKQALLVARDGVVFAGEGHDTTVVENLPWLDGIKLARRDGELLPIQGLEVVAELLARAREADAKLDAGTSPHAWRVISLARLSSDRELEVRTADGVTVVFSAQGDFFRQLAKLDFLWEALANAPERPARIDLTLGREVPIMLNSPAVPTPAPGKPSSASVKFSL